MFNRPLTKVDFYKTGHPHQYPKNTLKVYSNGTFRKSRIPGIDKIVFFGMQYICLRFLIYEWNKYFFNKPVEQVIGYFKRRLDNALGKDTVNLAHIRALHKLGYLPIKIKALPEGTRVPIGVSPFTITNTHDDFGWLPNALETAISKKIWKPSNSATIAFQYRQVFEQFYRETVGTPDNQGFILWQGHDFSSRGMSGDEDGVLSGGGHLLSFTGTDTVDAIDFLEDYYFADSDKEMIGGSVPATEHSVMCMGMQDGEFETFKRLITEIYPSGPISVVSDTWDYWQVLTKFLTILKNDILVRTGHPFGLDKVIIRPDSGDPYRIVCGYTEGEYWEDNGKFYTKLISKKEGVITELQKCEIDGSIQTLWNIFGGSITPLGYRELCPKIGLIYGDSITMDLQVKILQGLKDKGFASTNIVLGIGSFTYEMQTRDTFGFAMKATYGEILSSGKRLGIEIFKDPKTDDGTKKSAKGLLRVDWDERAERLVLKDQCTKEEEQGGLLVPVFENGKLLVSQSLSEIRTRIKSYL